MIELSERKPKVSVLISSYNAGDFLLSSVESALQQTLQDIEVLVMDDGSTDSSLDVLGSLKDPRLTVYSQKNSGKSAAMNALLELAQGEYVMIQDADDLSAPQRAQVLSELLDRSENLGFVLSGYALIADAKTVAPRRISLGVAECKAAISGLQMPSHDPTIMVRTAIFKQARLDPKLRVGQGIDLIYRLGETYDFMVTPEILYHYRVHDLSITRESVEKRVRALHVVTNLARKRRHQEPLSFEAFFIPRRRILEDKNNNLLGHLTDSTYLSVESGNRIEALSTAFHALSFAIKDYRYCKPLIYALLPRRLSKSIRGGRARVKKLR